AEDGIRDFHVTGVQTCALPIFEKELLSELKNISSSLSIIAGCLQEITKSGGFKINQTEKIEETHEETEDKDVQKKLSDFVMKYRSEERRVGKESGSGCQQ